MNKPVYPVTVRGPPPAGTREKLVAGHVEAVKKRKKKGV